MFWSLRFQLYVYCNCYIFVGERILILLQFVEDKFKVKVFQYGIEISSIVEQFLKFQEKDIKYIIVLKVSKLDFILNYYKKQ